MRKATIVVVAMVFGAFLAASGGEAGTGPRLSGSFQVTGAIHGNDIGIPAGTETTDVYVFKSTCKGSGGCASVGLTRKSGGRTLKSTLKRTAPGVYKGTEGPAPYTCVNPIGTPGQFTGEHKITVTKAKNGKATKFSGKLVIHITGCKETFEEASLVGKPSQ